MDGDGVASGRDGDTGMEAGQGRLMDVYWIGGGDAVSVRSAQDRGSSKNPIISRTS